MPDETLEERLARIERVMALHDKMLQAIAEGRLVEMEEYDGWRRELGWPTIDWFGGVRKI